MQKQNRFRSRQYLNWVKQQPCCCCEAPADDPHHVIGMYHLSGMGMQAPDSMCLPACRGCHDQIHRQPALQALQPEFLRETLTRGISIFDGEIREALIEAKQFLDRTQGE